MNTLDYKLEKTTATICICRYMNPDNVALAILPCQSFMFHGLQLAVQREISFRGDRTAYLSTNYVITHMGTGMILYRPTKKCYTVSATLSAFHTESKSPLLQYGLQSFLQKTHHILASDICARNAKIIKKFHTDDLPFTYLDKEPKPLIDLKISDILNEENEENEGAL